MTPRDKKLWKSRLRTLKRDAARDLGEQQSRPLRMAVDRVLNRLADEASAVHRSPLHNVERGQG